MRLGCPVVFRNGTWQWKRIQDMVPLNLDNFVLSALVTAILLWLRPPPNALWAPPALMLLLQSISLIQYIQSCPFELGVHFLTETLSLLIDRRHPVPMVSSNLVCAERIALISVLSLHDQPSSLLASRAQTCPKPASTSDPFPIQISTSDTSVRGN